MTSFPGCVTPTEIDPAAATPTEIDPSSEWWWSKPICGSILYLYKVERMFMPESEQDYYGTSSKLEISTNIKSEQVYFDTGTELLVERVI